MGKYKKILIFVLLCFFLGGCQKAPPEKPRLVTQVSISGTVQNAPFQAVYTKPEKMETVLYYLRGLNPRGKADTDPERIMGDRFKITVSLSDGSCQIYRQQADRFLSLDSRPWQRIDPKKGALLRPLLQSMPPDHSSTQGVYST